MYGTVWLEDFGKVGSTIWTLMNLASIDVLGLTAWLEDISELG